MHESFITDLKDGFSIALAEDRLHKRPCGFISDYKLIWLVGANIEYFKKSVLRFDFSDF